MNSQDELVECPTCSGRHPASVGTCPELEAVISRSADSAEGFDTSARFGRGTRRKRTPKDGGPSLVDSAAPPRAANTNGGDTSPDSGTVRMSARMPSGRTVSRP
jgi:hypothetical protein